MSALTGKVFFITGSSRGIGKEIALCAAKQGAHIAIISKTATPHPRLPGSIHQTAAEVIALGGKALPIATDIRFEEQIRAAVSQTVATFGQIDVLINNAGSIYLTNTLNTTPKNFDLMHHINGRGAFLCIQACHPHLKKASNPHIINISPPLNMDAQWFKDYLAYSLSKYTQSLLTLGTSAEFAEDGIAVNSLWPKTLINTSALSGLFNTPALVAEIQRHTRKASIVADAACYIATQPSRQYTGQFLLDEEVLKSSGMQNFSAYAVAPGVILQPDYYL